MSDSDCDKHERKEEETLPNKRFKGQQKASKFIEDKSKNEK